MDTHPSSRGFRFRLPLALAGLLTTFASVAHGQSSSPVEILEEDIAVLAGRIDSLSTSEGPDGALTREQIVELATRTAEVEERAEHVRVRTERLTLALESLHASADELSADAEQLAQVTP